MTLDSFSFVMSKGIPVCCSKARVGRKGVGLRFLFGMMGPQAGGGCPAGGHSPGRFLRRRGHQELP